MKKEEVRKEFFKLRIKHHSYNQCRKILIAKYGYEVTVRTLQRWTRKLNEIDWDLIDYSRRPKKIYYKITPEVKGKVLAIRKETGWCAEKIEDFVDLGHTTINKILSKHELTNPNPRRKKRIKYVRFQRKHPNSLWRTLQNCSKFSKRSLKEQNLAVLAVANFAKRIIQTSLWQIDHSDQKIKDKWLISIVDDCSRYSLVLVPVNQVTTTIVTRLLNELIKKRGKPREILSDNGSAYGLKSKHSKFDRWCNKRGIKHIRSAIHSPTTCGKVERLFQTFKQELPFCKCPEHFRMRYNHFRPHISLHRKTPASVYFRG